MSESLFCQKQIYISRGVDCDILQDQLVLGSCIVRYDLKPQSVLSICVSNVYDRKRLYKVIIAQLIHMHYAVGE